MVFSDFLEFRRLLIIIYCITKREPSPKSCVSHHVHNISRISSQPPVMWLYPTLERPRTQRYYLSLLVFSSCRLKHCSTDWLTPPNKFKKVVNQMYLPCNTFKINTACIYGLGQCKDILSQFRMLKDLRGQVQTLPKESIPFWKKTPPTLLWLLSTKAITWKVFRLIVGKEGKHWKASESKGRQRETEYQIKENRGLRRIVSLLSLSLSLSFSMGIVVVLVDVVVFLWTPNATWFIQMWNWNCIRREWRMWKANTNIPQYYILIWTFANPIPQFQFEFVLPFHFLSMYRYRGWALWEIHLLS